MDRPERREYRQGKKGQKKRRAEGASSVRVLKVERLGLSLYFFYERRATRPFSPTLGTIREGKRLKARHQKILSSISEDPGRRLECLRAF